MVCGPLFIFFMFLCENHHTALKHHGKEIFGYYSCL